MKGGFEVLVFDDIKEIFSLCFGKGLGVGDKVFMEGW